MRATTNVTQDSWQENELRVLVQVRINTRNKGCDLRRGSSAGKSNGALKPLCTLMKDVKTAWLVTRLPYLRPPLRLLVVLACDCRFKTCHTAGVQ